MDPLLRLAILVYAALAVVLVIIVRMVRSAMRPPVPRGWDPFR